MRQLCLQLQRHSSGCDLLLWWGVVKRVGINDVEPVGPGRSVSFCTAPLGTACAGFIAVDCIACVLVALASFSVLLPVVLVALVSFCRFSWPVSVPTIQ